MGPCQAKCICTAKDMIAQENQLPTEWRKKNILYASHRKLVSILHKELKNLNINKQTKQNRNDNNPA